MNQNETAFLQDLAKVLAKHQVRIVEFDDYVEDTHAGTTYQFMGQGIDVSMKDLAEHMEETK